MCIPEVLTTLSPAFGKDSYKIKFINFFEWAAEPPTQKKLVKLFLQGF